MLNRSGPSGKRNNYVFGKDLLYSLRQEPVPAKPYDLLENALTLQSSCQSLEQHSAPFAEERRLAKPVNAILNAVDAVRSRAYLLTSVDPPSRQRHSTWQVMREGAEAVEKMKLDRPASGSSRGNEWSKWPSGQKRKRHNAPDHEICQKYDHAPVALTTREAKDEGMGSKTGRNMQAEREVSRRARASELTGPSGLANSREHRAERRREKSRLAAQIRRNREGQILMLLQNALPIPLPTSRTSSFPTFQQSGGPEFDEQVKSFSHLENYTLPPGDWDADALAERHSARKASISSRTGRRSVVRHPGQGRQAGCSLLNPEDQASIGIESGSCSGQRRPASRAATFVPSESAAIWTDGENSVSSQGQAVVNLEKSIIIRIAGQTLFTFNCLAEDLGSTFRPSMTLHSNSLLGMFIDPTTNKIAFATPSLAEAIGCPWINLIGASIHDILKSVGPSPTSYSPHSSLECDYAMPDPVCFNEDRGFLTSPDPYLPSSTALPSLQIPSVCKRSYNLLLSNPTASRGFGLPSGEQMIRLYVFSAFSSHTALSEEAEEQASTESWESARHQTNFIPSKVQVGSLSPGADSQNLAAAGSEELREDVCFVETESSVPDERSSRGGSYLAEKVSKPLSCAGQPRVVQKPLAMLWSPILYRITANRAADRDGLYATPDMSPTWATAGCRRTSIGANSTGNGVVTNGSKSSSAITADSVAHAKRLQADEFAGYETQSSLLCRCWFVSPIPVSNRLPLANKLANLGSHGTGCCSRDSRSKMKVMPIEPSTSVAAIKPDSHQASLKKHLIMKSGVMIQGAKVPGKTTNSIGTWHSDYATYEVAKVEQEESTCLNNESYAGDEEDENIPVGCHLGLERVECEQRRKAVQGIRNSKCDEDSASDFDNCRRHSEDVFPGVYDKHASKDEDKYEGPRHLMLYLLQAISETRLSTSSSCLFAPLTNYECSCRLPSQTTSGNRVNNTSLTPQMSSTLENESVKIQTSTNETAKSCHTYFCDTSSHIQEGEPAETRNDSMTFSAKDERHAAISHAPCSHPSSCSPSLLSCQFRSVLDSVLTIQQLDERHNLPRDAIGQPWSNFIYPADLHAVLPLFQKALGYRCPVLTTPYRLLQKNLVNLGHEKEIDSYSWLRTCIKPVTQASGSSRKKTIITLACWHQLIGTDLMTPRLTSANFSHHQPRADISHDNSASHWSCASNGLGRPSASSSHGRPSLFLLEDHAKNMTKQQGPLSNHCFRLMHQDTGEQLGSNHSDCTTHLGSKPSRRDSDDLSPATSVLRHTSSSTVNEDFAHMNGGGRHEDSSDDASSDALIEAGSSDTFEDESSKSTVRIFDLPRVRSTSTRGRAIIRKRENRICVPQNFSRHSMTSYMSQEISLDRNKRNGSQRRKYYSPSSQCNHVDREGIWQKEGCSNRRKCGMKSKNESNSAFYRARRPSPLSSDFMNINDPNQSITKHHSIRGIQSKDSSSGLQSSKRKFSFNEDPERRQAHMEKLLQAERRRSFTTVGSLLQRPCLPSSGQQGKEGDEIVYPASDQVKHRWRRLIACRNPVSGGQKRLPMTSWCNTERLSPNLTPVDNSNPNSTAENSVNCLDGDSSDTEPGNQVEETFPMQAVRQPFFEISSLISPGNHVFLDDRLGNPSTGTIADNCIEEPFDLDQLHSPSIEELAQIAMGFSSPVELALENLSEEDPLSGSRDDTESFSDSLLEAGWPQSMRAADELANGCIVSDQVTSIAASPLVGQIGEESESYTSLNRSSPIDNLEIYFHPSLCANPTISTATPSFAHSNSLFPSASSSSSSSSSTSPLAFSIASTTPLIVPAQQAQDTASPDGLCELR